MVKQLGIFPILSFPDQLHIKGEAIPDPWSSVLSGTESLGERAGCLVNAAAGCYVIGVSIRARCSTRFRQGLIVILYGGTYAHMGPRGVRLPLGRSPLGPEGCRCPCPLPLGGEARYVTLTLPLPPRARKHSWGRILPVLTSMKHMKTISIENLLLIICCNCRHPQMQTAKCLKSWLSDYLASLHFNNRPVSFTVTVCLISV